MITFDYHDSNIQECSWDCSFRWRMQKECSVDYYQRWAIMTIPVHLPSLSSWKLIDTGCGTSCIRICTHIETSVSTPHWAADQSCTRYLYNPRVDSVSGCSIECTPCRLPVVPRTTLGRLRHWPSSLHPTSVTSSFPFQSCRYPVLHWLRMNLSNNIVSIYVQHALGQDGGCTHHEVPLRHGTCRHVWFECVIQQVTAIVDIGYKM